jgi:hypothetical protein
MRLPMPSSVVAAMKYNAERELLRIIYVSGDVYDYKQVLENVYKEMKASGSKGNYLNHFIKGVYEFERIN